MTTDQWVFYDIFLKLPVSKVEARSQSSQKAMAWNLYGAFTQEHSHKYIIKVWNKMRVNKNDQFNILKSPIALIKIRTQAVNSSAQ